MSAVVKFDNALALPTRQLKRPLSPPQIAQQVFGSVDGRQLVAFVLNTEESGKTAQLPVSVNAISFLRRLVAQFGGHRLEANDLLEGTLPTADNRAMALECLQMDDDDIHNQQMKHSRAKEVLDRLVGTGRHSSLVVNALMSAVGPIALVTNPQLNLCFERDLFGSVDGHQHVAFVLNTEEDENAVPVNAIACLRHLVAQFGGHRLEANDLLEGTLPTADNRAMALECLQMDDDGTHSQQTKHSRAKEKMPTPTAAQQRDSLMRSLEHFSNVANANVRFQERIRELETTVAQRNVQLQQNGTIIEQLRDAVLERDNQLEQKDRLLRQKDEMIERLQGYIYGNGVPLPAPAEQQQGGGGQ